MKDLAVLERTTSPATVEHVIRLGNNRHIQALSGPLDRNLHLISERCGISLSRLDCDLRLSGNPERMADAIRLVSGLCEKVKAGQLVSDEDLHLPDESAASAPVLITRKKPVAPRTEAQAAWVGAMLGHELSFGIGPAGTGKTYLAVAAGVSLLTAGKVDRLIFSRPAVEAGERIGFLPGDMKEKVDPYMQPIYDALNDFLPAKQAEKLIAERVIEIAPLAFMRGRTLSNAFVLLDEAQNATPVQMKMFLTRLGQGSRMVVTGDPDQTDLPAHVGSGLADAVRILDGVEGIGMARFTADDVVRHPLVARILKAWGGAA